MIKLKKVLFQKIDSNLDVQSETEINIMSGFNLCVRYSDDYEKCMAIFEQGLFAEECPDEFYINIKMTGFFDCNKTIKELSDKQKIHVAVYDILFPYMQEMVSELILKAGMTPLNLKKENITPEEVCIADKSKYQDFVTPFEQGMKLLQ